MIALLCETCNLGLAPLSSGLAPIKCRGFALTDSLFFELGGAEAIERGMAPNGVLKAIDVSGNVALGFLRG